MIQQHTRAYTQLHAGSLLGSVAFFQNAASIVEHLFNIVILAFNVMAGASSGTPTPPDFLGAEWSPPLTLNVVDFTRHAEGQRRTMWLSGWSEAGGHVVLRVEVISEARGSTPHPLWDPWREPATSATTAPSTGVVSMAQGADVSTTAGQGASVVDEENPWDSLHPEEPEPERTPAPLSEEPEQTVAASPPANE